MTNNTPNKNLSTNFSLKGFTSILIGVYIFIAGYFIEQILAGFLIDDHPLSMMSPEIVEIAIIAIAFFLILFSSLAFFFSGKRKAKKYDTKLWNLPNKKVLKIYFLGNILICTALFLLLKLGKIDFIIPIFFTLYALLLFVLKNKKRKNILVLSGVSILLATMCFLIPNYWASSLSILGIAHVAYGVAVKE